MNDVDSVIGSYSESAIAHGEATMQGDNKLANKSYEQRGHEQRGQVLHRAQCILYVNNAILKSSFKEGIKSCSAPAFQTSR